MRETSAILGCEICGDPVGTNPRYPTQVTRVFLLSLLCFAATQIACGRPQPRAPDEIQKQAKENKEPAFFDDLSLTDQQRQDLLLVVEGLYADFAEYDRIRLILLDETIAQIQAGRLDRERLLPLAEDAVSAFRAALPRGIEAMQKTHAILTRTQREKLVALFTKGRELSDEERRAARNEKVSRVLGLTTAQKAKIYPSLLALYIQHWKTIGRFRSAMHEAQDEFVKDTLVAKDLAIASDLQLMALGEVIFDALEIGMNNLTREQHQALAALLDAQLRSPNPTQADELPKDTVVGAEIRSEPNDLAPPIMTGGPNESR
jgi:Spy/CpxP family protein refolding chaperone